MKTLTLGQIEGVVRRHIDTSHANTNSRKKEVVLTRHILQALSWRFSTYTAREIAERWAGRNHATVHHAAKAIRNRTDTEPHFRNLMFDIIKDIRKITPQRQMTDYQLTEYCNNSIQY